MEQRIAAKLAIWRQKNMNKQTQGDYMPGLHCRHTRFKKNEAVKISMNLPDYLIEGADVLAGREQVTRTDVFACALLFLIENPEFFNLD